MSDRAATQVNHMESVIAACRGCVIMSVMKRIVAIDVTDEYVQEFAANGSKSLAAAIGKALGPISSGSEIREVGMGVAFRFPKVLRITDESVPEIYCVMAIDYDSKLGIAVPVSVQVVRRSPGVQITSNTLRQLPIRTYIREGLKSSALLKENGKNVPWEIDANWSEADEEHPDGVSSRGPSAQVLRTVIRVYRIAEVANDSPAKTVQETFDLAPATATRWIRKAKERYPYWREAHSK